MRLTETVQSAEAKGGEPIGFEPIGDVARLIDIISSPYRERPEAVLRELLQNASDAVQMARSEPQFAEVAILKRDSEIAHGQFHLVIRDSGIGMTPEQLHSELRVLGANKEKTRASASSQTNTPQDSRLNIIGKYGVGFYSVTAICFDVVLVTKTATMTKPIAWRYTPSKKMFFDVSNDELDALCQMDFDRHTHPTRRRTRGTSVYLRLDLQTHSVCKNWLQPNDLLLKLKHDCLLLPLRLYIADYSTSSSGGEIRDIENRDWREESLSLDAMPWQGNGPAEKNAVTRLLKQTLPYHKDDNLPTDIYSFCEKVGDGELAGFFFLVRGSVEGRVELFLQRMRVETSTSIVPICTSGVFGYVNITPGPSQFNVDINPQRDHLIRDVFYRMVRRAIEEASINFFDTLGRSLREAMTKAIGGKPDVHSRFIEFETIVRRSTLFSFLFDYTLKHIRHFLLDMGEVLIEVISSAECPSATKDAIAAFISPNVAPVAPGELVNALRGLVSHYQQQSENEEVLERGGVNARRQWNATATRSFFKNVGPYLPVRVHGRVDVPGGGFQVRAAWLPLCCVPLLDPQTLNGIPVLVKGRPDDYFARNPEGRVLVEQDSPDSGLTLSLVSWLQPRDSPLHFRFVAINKDLFKTLARRDEWVPLIEMFQQLLAASHGSVANAHLVVDARGYEPNFVPIVTTKEGDAYVIVINGYNDLMKGLNPLYVSARRSNDSEVVKAITDMCHVLYHHAQVAEAEGAGEDSHSIETRNNMVKSILPLLEKYVDLNRARGSA